MTAKNSTELKIISLRKALEHSPFVLAPMAGITDSPFRQFMKDLGCEILISELISAKGLIFGGEKSLKLLEFSETEKPVGIQLFGEEPEAMAGAAKLVEERGADFVDLNLGCPVNKVVKKGAGSALLKDLGLLEEIIDAIQDKVTIPVSIKIRTGWDTNTRNADQLCNLAHKKNLLWVAIHGRTRSQAYSGQADWDYIKKIKEQSPVPVIGNGDLTLPELAARRLDESGCDGVMIGRGALKNPLIFQQCMSVYSGRPYHPENNHPLDLVKKLHYYYSKTAEPKVCLLQIKKFASWFSAGYPESADFRKNLFSSADVDQSLSVISSYFKKFNIDQRKDTSREAFLMGGHG